jgi:hypothetical protein
MKVPRKCRSFFWQLWVEGKFWQRQVEGKAFGNGDGRDEK